MQSTCERCSSPDLLTVNLAPEGERTVTFRTCRKCEHRWWEDTAEAEIIALDDVLAAIAR